MGLNFQDDRKKQEVEVKKELSYVFEAIKRVRFSLKGRVPLIGFCGGSFFHFF
mgnify:CR=1 FL=1